MSKKILHVCNLDKFIPPFIDFVEEHFELDEHFFWLNGDHVRYPVQQEVSNYKVAKGKLNQLQGYAELIKQMHKADKIILHGLFIIRIEQILWAMPWLLKKCYWVMWGADLYVYQFGEKNWEWKKREFFRRRVIKKMNYLVTGTPGDVELARKWYGAKGQHIVCFNYTSNIYRPLPSVINEKSGISILVGNSADPTNNHIKIFDKINGLVDDEDVHIYCPLSYGDKKYAEYVCVEGKRIFGDKFYPLLDFMCLKDYLEFLAGIDIAIFDHHRQQAFGNTLSLLGFGKKVYINPVSTLNGVFDEYDVKVYDSESIDLMPIDKLVANKNKFNVEKHFSEKKLIESLKKWIG